jgi:hypothetical protein
MSKNFKSPGNLRWLTLYLLVVLAILLFVANLFATNSSASSTTALTREQIHSNETATATAIKHATETATAIANNARSLNEPQLLALTNLDTNGLIKNTQAAIDNVKKQIHQDSKLTGREAAFVVIYIDVPDQNQLPTAQKLNQKIQDILKGIDTFKSAVYQPVIFTGMVTDGNISPTTKDLSEVDLNIYLYAQK